MSNKGGFLVAFVVVVFLRSKKHIGTNTHSFETDKAMPIETRRAAEDVSVSE